MSVEDWEYERACVNGPGKPVVNPEWWAIEAPKSAHMDAEAVCWRCPVREQCERQTQEDIISGKHVHGMYAGRIRGPKCGVAGLNVDDYRRMLRGTLEVVEAADEERRCEGPGCEVTFSVTTRMRSKKFCSPRCSSRSRPHSVSVRGPRKRKVASA